jgi:hypothetical protein
MTNSTQGAGPAKPYPEYPVLPHARGRWTEAPYGAIKRSADTTERGATSVSARGLASRAPRPNAARYSRVTWTGAIHDEVGRPLSSNDNDLATPNAVPRQRSTVLSPGSRVRLGRLVEEGVIDAEEIAVPAVLREVLTVAEVEAMGIALDAHAILSVQDGVASGVTNYVISYRVAI